MAVAVALRALRVTAVLRILFQRQVLWTAKRRYQQMRPGRRPWRLDRRLFEGRLGNGGDRTVEGRALQVWSRVSGLSWLEMRVIHRSLSAARCACGGTRPMSAMSTGMVQQAAMMWWRWLQMHKLPMLEPPPPQQHRVSVCVNMCATADNSPGHSPATHGVRTSPSSYPPWPDLVIEDAAASSCVYGSGNSGNDGWGYR